MLPSSSPALGKEEEESNVDVVGGQHGMETMTNTKQSKRYLCQRCLNHGVDVARKNHKKQCPFAQCDCQACVLVESRKLLNREINKELTGDSAPTVTSPPVAEEMETQMVKTVKRNPKCARCRAHHPDVEPPPIKGHKRKCRYDKCECRKCQLVTSRRDVMAQQIRLRRKQSIHRARLLLAGFRSDSRSDTQTVTLGSETSSPIGQPSQNTVHPSIDQLHAHNDVSVVSDVPSRDTHQQYTPNNPQIPDINSLYQCPCSCMPDSSNNPYQQLSVFLPIPIAPAQQHPMGLIPTHALLANFMEYLKNVTGPSPAQQRGSGLNLPTTPAGAMAFDGIPSPISRWPTIQHTLCHTALPTTFRHSTPFPNYPVQTRPDWARFWLTNGQ